MRNNSHSPVTEMLSGKYKVWLAVELAIMLCADLAICVYVQALGFSDEYRGVPIFLTAVDALYLAAVCVSNQRFTYAKQLYVFYAVAAGLLIIAWANVLNSRNGTAFAGASSALWITLHVLGVVGSLVTYLYAAKRLRGARTLQLLFAAVALAAVLAVALIYGASIATVGYFGQGHVNRNLLYAVSDDGASYEVIDVLDGTGDGVVVPYEFDGKPVSAVHMEVFEADGINRVTLNCAGSATIVAEYDFDVPETLKIYAERDSVDAFKKAFYDIGKNTGNVAAYSIGNRIIPANLGANEVCVTFGYESGTYPRTGNATTGEFEIIPTWYGKKGDVFELDHVSGIEYAEKSDKNSDEHLYAAYNRGRYIMSELVVNDVPLAGMRIDGSKYGVPVNFELVHAIYPGKGNDEDKFATAKVFPYSTVADKKLDCKLTVAENADKIFSAFDRGEGFGTDWLYETGKSDKVVTQATGSLKSLSELFAEQAFDKVTIFPKYSLVEPKVAVTATDDKFETMYGNRFGMTATVTHPIATATIGYRWHNALSSSDGTEMTYETEHYPYAQNLSYELYVSVSAPTLTDLKSNVTRKFTVASSPRPLPVIWQDPENNVYDGTEKKVTASLIDVVPGDEVAVQSPEFGFTHAGVYEMTANVIGAGNSYRLTDVTHKFEILPRPTTVVWGAQRSRVYNKQAFAPTATAVDINGERLDVTVTGAKTDAGSYEAGCMFKNADYTATAATATCAFTVEPFECDIVWGVTRSFVFNGTVQKPTATARGVGGETVLVSVDGGQRNANMRGDERVEIYAATARISDKNYSVKQDGASVEFDITQKPVDVFWENKTIIYDGNPNAPTASATDVNRNELAVDVSGAQTDCGNYTATARIADANYTVNNPAPCAFMIVRRELAVVWSNNRLEYNGEQQQSTATAIGAKGENIPLTLVGSGKNCGSYSISASITEDAHKRNYTLVNNGAWVQSVANTLVIVKRPITINWTNTEFVYDGEPHFPTGTVQNAIGAVTVDYGASKTDAGNYVATATLRSDANHEITVGASVRFDIIKRVVTVVWQDGQSYVYNGMSQAPVPSAVVNCPGKAINGRSLTIGCNAGINAGSYTATASISGADGKNYALANATRAFTITKKPIVVTIDGKTITYGSSPTYTSDVNNRLADADKGNSAKFKIVYFDSGTKDRFGKIPFGEYDINARFEGTSVDNYAVTVNSGVLVVNKYTLTELVWSRTSFTYNGTVQTPTATAVGVNGETLTLTVSGGEKNAGNYTAVASAQNDNYAIAQSAATKSYTIGKKRVTVTIASATVSVGQEPTLVYDIDGKIAGDIIVVSCYVVYGDGSIDKAGRYAIKCTYSEQQNYDVTVVDGTLTVTE